MKGKYILFALVIFYLAARLLVLFLSPYLYNAEECYRGTVAKEIMQGSRFNLFDLQYTPYEGGSLLVSMLAAILFGIFGVSIVSLKLVALSFSIATLVLILLFLWEHFGKKAAVISAVLFTLAPPVYSRRSLTSLGDYGEPLFGIAIMYLFFKVNLANKRSPLWLALFGFFCGFAVWFHYINLIMVAACLIYWSLQKRRLFVKREFRIVLLFFLIGFSPWFYYNFTHAFAGLGRLYDAFYKSHSIIEKLQTVRANLADLSPRLFGALFHFQDIRINIPNAAAVVIQAQVMAITYYAIFIFAGLYLLAQNRKFLGKESFILFYIALFSFVYVITDYAADKHLHWHFDPARSYFVSYLFMLIPFIIIVLSITIGGTLSEGVHKSARYMGRIFLIALISIGALGNLRLLYAQGEKAKKFIGNPFDYRFFSATLGENFAQYGSLERALPRLREEEKPFFYFGLGCENYHSPYGIKVAEMYRHYYFAGIGFRLYDKFNYKEALQKISQLNGEDRTYALAMYLSIEKRKRGALTGQLLSYKPFLDGLEYDSKAKEINSLLAAIEEFEYYDGIESWGSFETFVSGRPALAVK